MVMHYHFGVSPVNYSDYDSLHKVYLEYINMLKMNFTSPPPPPPGSLLATDRSKAVVLV